MAWQCKQSIIHQVVLKLQMIAETQGGYQIDDFQMAHSTNQIASEKQSIVELRG